MRLSVRIGPKIKIVRSNFHGPSTAHRTSRRARCSAEPLALSPRKVIPGSSIRQEEKRTLPGTMAGVFEVTRVTANFWSQTLEY